MMKTKFSLLIFALLFVCSGMMAQDKICLLYTSDAADE